MQCWKVAGLLTYAARQIAEVPFYISGNYYSGLVPILISE